MSHGTSQASAESSWRLERGARRWAWLAAALVLSSSCTDRNDAASDVTSSVGEGDPSHPAQAVEDPLGFFVDTAGGYVQSVQQSDGSWPYYRSETADFLITELSPPLPGTLTTMMNLTGTAFEASPAFDRGADYVKSSMTERHTWSRGELVPPSDAFLIEPDADTTSAAMVVLSGRIPVEGSALTELRALFDRNRASGGLYRTYFEGFYPEKGFVPEGNLPSIGVNLKVLAFFGKYGLERASLLAALRTALQDARYWEKSPVYPSLPMLAYFASNAVEHGAPEAGEFLRKFVADYAAEAGTDPSVASRLSTVTLAALVKARSHACLLARTPCQDLDLWVFELAKRRQADGSWPTAAFGEKDVNEDALRGFLERRDFAIAREGGGVRFDAARALASPGTLRVYGGSPAETTSFALKALSVYRELLQRRANF